MIIMGNARGMTSDSGCCGRPSSPARRVPLGRRGGSNPGIRPLSAEMPTCRLGSIVSRRCSPFRPGRPPRACRRAPSARWTDRSSSMAKWSRRWAPKTMSPFSTTPTTSTTRCASSGSRSRARGSRPGAWRSSARCGRRTSTAPGLRGVRPLPALGGPRLRHPGRPDSAILRRVQPARLQLRQPGDRLPARLPVLTSIRPDAVPATADDLLRMRAGVGSRPFRSATRPRPRRAPGHRLPLGHRRAGALEGGHRRATGPSRAGTLSDPRANDNNGSPAGLGPRCVRPAIGLILGASAARGPG